MLHEFLSANKAELIERCRAKVARRSAPRATLDEIDHGIPLFLGQLIETFRIEESTSPLEGRRELAAMRPADRNVRSEISTTAAKHGSELLRRGFTVDQVVHDYGDLCQAITELAVETKVDIPAAEFHTLNLSLDNAIADAVTAFGGQRDRKRTAEGDQATNERLGSLAHELRNFLNTATLSFTAMKSGGVGLQGATAAVHERSLAGLANLINGALADVRLAAGLPLQLQDIAVDRLIAEIQASASLEAREEECEFTVSPVDSGLVVRADKAMLCSAVSNLLQNAFKFTRAHGHVSLKTYGSGAHVLIEIADECGGLPEGKRAEMFGAFKQHDADRGGLGLSIARRAVEASGGTLSLRDMPGIGCVFTIDLPRAPPLLRSIAL